MDQEAESGTDGSSSAREFLTFTLGAEEYAIDILKVQEIRCWEGVTSIANTPEFIKGVINLRGNIVPIVDLRLKFALASEPVYTETTIVIILLIAGRMVGAVVDTVSDVISLTEKEIKAAPSFNSTIDTDFIFGLGTQDHRMLVLVDIEKLMTSSEMALMDGATQ
jgi:purine-binding chemotaxis protein CheW